jgi:autotransporter-associated beta strand protein
LRLNAGSWRLGCLVALLAAAPASAQVVCPAGASTWTGATSNNWRTASNWSPVGVPGNGANVCFSTPNPTPTLAGGPPPRLGTIYILAGTSLSLTSAGGSMFLAGGIRSDGSFAFLGTRTLLVSGAQTWALGSSSSTISWPVTFQSAVTVSGAGDLTLSGAIAGGGRVTKTSTGALRLTATGSTHAGGFTVNAGLLSLTGTLVAEGTVAINAGATLSGTGTLASSQITVANGGNYLPGLGGAGTLSSNALQLGNTSTLSFTVGSTSTRGAVTGALVLDGVLDVAAGAGFGQGTYTLFTATGTITNNGLVLGAVPSGFSYAYQVSGGSVTLIVGPPATEVRLVRLDAVSSGASTQVTWETGSETRTLGYRVHRDESGQRRQISGLIAGSALRAGFDPLAGRNYSFVDLEGQGGGRYWIEAIDQNGRGDWFGPVQAHGGSFSGARSSALLTGFAPPVLTAHLDGDARPADPVETDRSWRDGSLLRQWDVAASGAVKLLVRQDGVYRVPVDQLLAAGFPPGAPIASVQLWAGGRPIAFRALSADASTLRSGDALEFFGQAADTRYTDTRVYWVTTGLGSPAVIDPAQEVNASSTATSFLETLEIRERTLHIPALVNPDADGFFGPPLIGTSPTNRVFSTPALDVLGQGPAVLEVSIQGLTNGPHSVDVQVNGTAVGTLQGAHQEVVSGSFTLPPGTLMVGENTVSLVGRTEDEIAVEISQRLSYPRRYAFDGPLRFTVPGGAKVLLEGADATGTRVLDITRAFHPLLVRTVSSSSGASLTASGAGTRILYAYRDDDVLAPTVVRDLPSSWHESEGAELVVIGPRALLPSLQPLVDQRTREGLTVALVDIADVYDEFSAGEKDAEALRGFLGHALRSWSTRPRFVLLAGAATYDPRGWLGHPELDQVPTIQIPTRYLQTGSDDALVTLDSSGFPSLAVGRLPFTSPVQMDPAVAKILERAPARPEGSILLVRDHDGTISFSAASAEVRRALSGWSAQDLARGLDDAATHTALLEALRSGPVAVDYQGHGAEDLWAGRILSDSDVESLGNAGKTTLLVASTCLNAYFLDIGRESLGAALLRTPGGGAWGVWASSGMTLPTDHPILSSTLLSSALDGGKTLGEATLAAKQAVTDPEVRATFHLLGDPSARAVESKPALTVATRSSSGALGCTASGASNPTMVFLALVALWLSACRPALASRRSERR